MAGSPVGSTKLAPSHPHADTRIRTYRLEASRFLPTLPQAATKAMNRRSRNACPISLHGQSSLNKRTALAEVTSRASHCSQFALRRNPETIAGALALEGSAHPPTWWRCQGRGGCGIVSECPSSSPHRCQCRPRPRAESLETESLEAESLEAESWIHPKACPHAPPARPHRQLRVSSGAQGP